MTAVVLAHSRYRYPGGEERHLELLERQLRAAGVSVRRYERQSPTEPGAVERLRVASGLVYRRGVARDLARDLAEQPADVVHFHNLMPMLTPAALRAARRSGAAVVLTIHNYRLFCPAGTLTVGGVVHDDCVEGSSLACALRRPSRGILESAAYGAAIELHRRLRLVQRWVDAYVCPSPHLLWPLARAGFSAERLHAIAYGVEITAEPESLPKRFVLFAGRLSEEKGIETLLAAAQAAPDVPLVVAGDGPLRQMVERASGGSLTYVGRLAAPELKRLRREAACLVAPSEWPDVQPFAVLESLADGVPVVTTPAGGLAHVAAGGGCLLVRQRDPVSLAETMRRVWRDEGLRERLRKEALDSARSHYSVERQTAKLRKLYEGLASAKRVGDDRRGRHPRLSAPEEPRTPIDGGRTRRPPEASGRSSGR
jgi:glycosyltransferase involved in cell wall biosynthesis